MPIFIWVSNENIIRVCQESTSMAQAASTLKMHYNTLKRKAVELGCFKPNPSGKGIPKPYKGTEKIDLDEILNGLHPHYQTFKLKNRLFRSRRKENKCEICGTSEWNGKPLNCELDHIDGDRTNHKFENLRIICPNCHSQTDTFRAKNIKP